MNNFIRILFVIVFVSNSMLLTSCNTGGGGVIPLIASAGSDQSVSTSTVVTLNGSASTGPDGFTYAWTLTSIPATSAAVLSNPTSVNPTFTADLAGTYVAQLIISDGINFSTPDTVSITASPSTTTVDLVVNGSFESGLSSWLQGASTASPAGTCGWNSASPAPGTETTTSTAGFAATDGTANAVGGLTQTGAGQSSCVLYQDVTIPVGATTANFSADVGIKYLGGKSVANAAIFWGLYSAASIPNYSSSRLVTFTPGVYEPASSNTVLVSFSATGVNVASRAGQTVRLAFINASDSTTGFAVVGIDNVKLSVIVAH